MDNNKSEELIQREMQETRASLTQKLETLEQKVVGTVEGATTAVSETVEAIKESVHDTVATVNATVKDSVDTVKDFLDVPAHVQQHPWLMVGGSVAVGYCLGTLLAQNPRARFAPAPSGPAWQPSNRISAPPSTSAPAEPSMWAAEVTKLKGLALGVLFGAAREMLVSAVPEHLGEQLKEVVDSVTRKAGGEPLPSSDLASICEPTPADGEQHEQDATATSFPQAQTTGNGHSAARRW
jgi:ElaB/YqjD/DUF883 family membrane-anchored ribosome-binding protein